MDNSLIEQNIQPTAITGSHIDLMKERLSFMREDLIGNPYIDEALRVLPVGGFRSAIGLFWNAVVDDLRKKVMHRSLALFNKEVDLKREVKCYEDFQDFVNDDQLLEGAYKIGVIGWEANKVLRHAKETRHIFDGHPASSDPSPIKVLGMIEDCVKYVLSQEYPVQIIDIDEYISVMGMQSFDRNDYSVSNAMSDLPDRYKTEMINRFFSAYINENCSSILRSNIEYVAPLLWRVLPKSDVLQICQRVDKEIAKGNVGPVEYSLKFIDVVDAKKYLSTNVKKYILTPIITRLNENLDVWQVENECVYGLRYYAGYIPRELIYDYVNGLTQTYVGYMGGSAYFARTDFYANGAAVEIPDMFSKFDDESVQAFIKVIRTNKTLQERIHSHKKLGRLRVLANIAYKRISEQFPDKAFLELLLDEEREKEFFKSL